MIQSELYRMLHRYRTQDKEPKDNIMQNIPSHTKEIRLMFTAGYTDYEIETSTDRFEINEEDEIETNDGWMLVKNLTDSYYIHDVQSGKYFKLLSVTDSGKFRQLIIDLSQYY